MAALLQRLPDNLADVCIIFRDRHLVSVLFDNLSHRPVLQVIIQAHQISSLDRQAIGHEPEDNPNTGIEFRLDQMGVRKRPHAPIQEAKSYPRVKSLLSFGQMPERGGLISFTDEFASHCLP